jgi:hypothetical protein
MRPTRLTPASACGDRFMTPQKPFAIHIAEPYTASGFLAPEDPLGELSDAERDFRKFCFEHNHAVKIRVNDKERRALLFPDVALAYARLREVPDRLEQNVDAIVEFPEGMFRLVFRPDRGEVECRLDEYGYQHSTTSAKWNVRDVVAVVTAFVDDVRARAESAGYSVPET